ncbi:polyprotein of viral origin, putative, partial [Ixodes scapularis]
VVVPAVSRNTVLRMCHDSVGHMDVQRTQNQIQKRYWWPCMSRHVKAYVQYSQTCRRVNRRTTIAEGFFQPRTITAAPNKVISLDNF